MQRMAMYLRLITLSTRAGELSDRPIDLFVWNGRFGLDDRVRQLTKGGTGPRPPEWGMIWLGAHGIGNGQYPGAGSLADESRA